MADAKAAKGNGASTGREIAPLKRTGATWRLHEHANNEYRAFVDKSVELEDLKDQRFWSVVAQGLEPYDRIYVVREDRAYWVELLVLDAGPGFAQVLELRRAAPLPEIASKNLDDLPAGVFIEKDPRTQRFLAKRKNPAGDVVTLNGDGDLSYFAAKTSALNHASMRG